MKKVLFLVFLVTALSISPPVQSDSNPDEQSISVAFSPHGGTTEALVRLISEAKHSIRVAAYNFTSKEIAKALMDAHKNGVDVQVVLDRSNAKAKYSSATFLANVGVPIRIDYKYAIMHNKFMVIDDVTVETGSFNYTDVAEKRNAENIIVLQNYPDIAEQYLEDWQKLWDESKLYKATR